MKLKLHHQVFLALFLGLLVGVASPELAKSLSFLGELFIRLLRFLIVPLVFASLLIGVVSIGDGEKIGRLGLKTAGYFVGTTLISIVIGLVMVNIFQPGLRVMPAQDVLEEVISTQPKPTLVSVLMNIVPQNPVEAVANGNMLPIIFTAVFFGLGLAKIGQSGAGVVSFFEGLNQLMNQLTKWIISLSPIGVFSLISNLVATSGLATLKPLALYILTVIVGLLIQSLGVLPAILVIAGRYSPLRLARHLTSGLATGFSAASSAAGLPILLELLVEKVKMPNRIVSFVMPLGITVNMNGTALYQAVAVGFIAQYYGIPLGMNEYLLIMLTGTLAAVGAAGIPSAGLFTMGMILSTVGVTLEGVALILAVDRIVDMCRTTVNLWGNSVGAVVLSR